MEGWLSVRDLWDKIWYDKNGKIAIWQTPNLWLIGWAVLTMISLLVSGRTSDIFSWAAHAALIVWSLRELLSGVNYLRRGLGLAVLIFAVMSLIQNL